MEHWSLLAQGLFIGLAIAAPVGPIGILCIRRTLVDGPRSGLISGLGAASADAVYGCLAAFGATLLTAWLIEHQFWIRLAGSFFLAYIGWRILTARPAALPATAPAVLAGAGTHGSLSGAYGTTFALTLTNPLTILSFTAVFASAGVIATGSTAGALLLVLGVFLGSALWWATLSGSVAVLRSRINAPTLRRINRTAGLIILGFSAWYMLNALQ